MVEGVGVESEGDVGSLMVVSLAFFRRRHCTRFVERTNPMFGFFSHLEHDTQSTLAINNTSKTWRILDHCGRFLMYYVRQCSSPADSLQASWRNRQ